MSSLYISYFNQVTDLEITRYNSTQSILNIAFPTCVPPVVARWPHGDAQQNLT